MSCPHTFKHLPMFLLCRLDHGALIYYILHERLTICLWWCTEQMKGVVFVVYYTPLMMSWLVFAKMLSTHKYESWETVLFKNVVRSFIGFNIFLHDFFKCLNCLETFKIKIWKPLCFSTLKISVCQFIGLWKKIKR